MESNESLIRLEKGMAVLLDLCNTNNAAIIALGKRVDEGFERIEARFVIIEGGLTSMENRMTSLENRMASIEARVTSIEKQLVNVEDDLSSIKSQLNALSISTSNNFSRIDAQLEKIMFELCKI